MEFLVHLLLIKLNNLNEVFCLNNGVLFVVLLFICFLIIFGIRWYPLYRKYKEEVDRIKKKEKL
jgi:capsule polysaccharide export protein KpsC/LpsZ